MTTTPITMDLTPTWADVLPILLAGLENGTEEGRKIAREELSKMAKLADFCNECRGREADLLAVLQKSVRFGGLYPDLKEEAEAVIAKATGSAV